MAKFAAPIIRISASRQCFLARMKKAVIGSILTNHQIRIRIIAAILIKMMNRMLPLKVLADCFLGNKNMLRNESARDELLSQAGMFCHFY
jgi:hypothetical protein